MRFRGIAVLAAAVSLSVLLAATARADTIVVAGEKTVSSARFVLEADDIFAPLLPALQPLVSKSSVVPDAVRLTTRAGREIVISRDRPEATVDGTLRTMPALPKIRGQVVLLPAKATGSLLGCSVRWDEAARLLYLHPWVRQFTVEARPDRYRVVVGAEAPLVYHADKQEDPSRLVVDLPNMDLADVPSSFAIDRGYLQYARIAQRTLAPDPEGDSVRLVVGVKQWRPYRIRLSDDRCRLEVDLPLPDRDLPSDAPPITLLGLGFRRYSPRLAELVVSTSGKAHFTSGKGGAPTSVWVDVENAENRIAMPDPPPTDRIVKEVKVEPVAGKPGVQHLALSLSEPTPFRVVAEATKLRVVLGQAELSGLSIVVDAGHGGWDPGAVGRTGLSEKDVNLDIALRLARLLEEAGARVVLTRDDDGSVNGIYNGDTAGRRKELLSRCDLANEAGGDLYVAIHCNSRGYASKCGTETFYRKADSAEFAQVLQEETVKTLGRPDGGAHRHPKAIIVLYGTEMPAALVEVAYISNSTEEALLATKEFRQQAAYGIFNGIARYVRESGLLPAPEIGPRSAPGRTLPTPEVQPPQTPQTPPEPVPATGAQPPAGEAEPTEAAPAGETPATETTSEASPTPGGAS
jgi:N-acetylmuramoyl-L-alanine amidase CwlD